MFVANQQFALICDLRLVRNFPGSASAQLERSVLGSGGQTTEAIMIYLLWLQLRCDGSSRERYKFDNSKILRRSRYAQYQNNWILITAQRNGNTKTSVLLHKTLPRHGYTTLMTKTGRAQSRILWDTSFNYGSCQFLRVCTVPTWAGTAQNQS